MLGGSTGRVTLDQEKLASLRVPFLAIGELARESSGIERSLAAGEFPSFAGGFARAGGINRLGADLAANCRILLKMLHQLLVDEAGNGTLDVTIEPALGLTLELRLGKLDADHRYQAFADVLTLKVLLHLFEEVLVLTELVDGAGEGGTEAGKVCAAIHGVDVVGEGKDVFCVRIIVLQRELHVHVVTFSFGVDGRSVQHLLVLV